MMRRKRTCSAPDIGTLSGLQPHSELDSERSSTAELNGICGSLSAQLEPTHSATFGTGSDCFSLVLVQIRTIDSIKLIKAKFQINESVAAPRAARTFSRQQLDDSGTNFLLFAHQWVKCFVVQHPKLCTKAWAFMGRLQSGR